MSYIRTVTVTRYMQPFREGGSLPALAETDDGFKHVVKFRSASIQTSRPHPGVSDDLEKAAEKLFDEMVA